MSQAARLGSLGSGHGSYPARRCITGSSDVFINGIGAHRVGDIWEVHCNQNEPHDCHASILAQGSGTVFVNGRPLGRVGDLVACGSTIITGSANVFSG